MTGDASLAWMSRAVSEVVASQISASSSLHPVVIGARRDAPLVAATDVLDGYFTNQGGRLRIYASVMRLDRNRAGQVFKADGPATGGILPLADSIARRIEPAARPFSTRNEAALKAYAEGRAGGDPAAFERAAAADPDFGAAYLGWAQAMVSRGDSAGAEMVLGIARARGAGIMETDQARLDLLHATLRGDRAGRHRALSLLARLTPADSDVLRGLAAAEVAAHRYQAAAGWYRKAAAQEPENALTWNDLGYVEAFARNLEGAREALREYQRLAPDEANPLDSLGDVHFHLGRFREAEDHYLSAFQKNPGFLGGATLYKAARARLMTGDVAGAGEIFGRFMFARRGAKDALLDYREAQWRYLTGRHGEAIAQLERFTQQTSGAADVASQAFSQMAAWAVVSGEPGTAQTYAVQAIRLARSPESRSLAAICRFLSEPAASPGELSASAQRAFSNPADSSTLKPALGYALLLGGHYREAATLLRELAEETSPASGNPVNVLLAWALVETGRHSEAAGLLDTYWIPQPGGEQPFAFLAFPRIFELQGAVLNEQGRGEEARRALEVFRKLSRP